MLKKIWVGFLASLRVVGLTIVGIVIWNGIGFLANLYLPQYDKPFVTVFNGPVSVIIIGVFFILLNQPVKRSVTTIAVFVAAILMGITMLSTALFFAGQDLELHHPIFAYLLKAGIFPCYVAIVVGVIWFGIWFADTRPNAETATTAATFE